MRAIETRTFFRVGGVRKVEVNVRIVAATNRNLESVVANESFRSDLLYRINGFQIDLAPLRDRPEDIEPLARHMLKNMEGETAPELELTALEAMRSYSWPGNVRQLKNCLERAVILSNNGRITINELPPEVIRPSMRLQCFRRPSRDPAELVTPRLRRAIRALLLRFARCLLSRFWRRGTDGWHRGKTAEILGSHLTLYRRLRDYNLERRNG